MLRLHSRSLIGLTVLFLLATSCREIPEFVGVEDGGEAVDGGQDASLADGGEDPSPGACSGMSCYSPPESECEGADGIVVHSPVGYCALGQCRYATRVEQCESGECERGVCAEHPCQGITCNHPPAPRCDGANTLLVYNPIGYCSEQEGQPVCGYASNAVVCGRGCEDGACVGEPCASVVCNTPPARYCDEDGELVVFNTIGHCTEGDCEYAEQRIPCDQGCDEGTCKGEDACTHMTCNVQPASYCVDDKLRVFESQGGCEQGFCLYAHQDIDCRRGCEGGQCQGDPCAGVSCNAPPAPTCEDESTLRTWDGFAGQCEGGACIYGTVLAPCPDGCSNGACKKDRCTGITCTSPPADRCDDNVAVTHDPNGTCLEGVCNYESVRTTCGGLCTLGTCVDCIYSSDCNGGVGQWCNAGTCESCDSDAHCGSGCTDCTETGQICDDAGSACVDCIDTSDCNGGVGQWCNAGTCESCDSDTHCGSGCTDCTETDQMCDNAGTACVDCIGSSDCNGGVGQWCDAGTCESCDTNEHCGEACVDCAASGTSCNAEATACVDACAIPGGATLQQCIEQSPDGATIHIGPDPISANVVIADKQIVINGNSTGPLTSWTCEDKQLPAVQLESGADVTFEGIVFEDCNSSDSVSDSFDSGAIQTKGPDAVRIRGCIFRNNANHRGPVINTWHGSPFPDDALLLIENTIMHDNHADDGGVMYINGSTNIQMINNLIYDNRADDYCGAVWVRNQVRSNLIFQKNVVYGNTAGRAAALATFEGEGPIIDSSIVTNNSPSDREGSWGTSHSMIGGDAQFTSPSTGDFSLQPTSTAIDAGDPALPQDADETRTDQGCYLDRLPVEP